MTDLVIVAIPSEDDYVWKISTEKVPHLTVLFLGDALSNPQLSVIRDFVEHAAETMLTRFTLSVDHRGTLGADNADVLFFEDEEYGGFENLEQFRAALLQNDAIRKAYDSVEQFPEFQPHLTLGYPESPAKPDNRDYPGIDYVSFDKIAVWYTDYAGSEFQLPRERWDVPMGSAMMSSSNEVEQFLEHHGVKGMKWGVRRERGAAVVKQFAQRSGKSEKKSTPHQDSAVARSLAEKMKKEGMDSLSNKEMQHLINRMNLEKQMSTLESAHQNPAKQFVENTLKGAGKNQANMRVNQAMTTATGLALAKVASSKTTKKAVKKAAHRLAGAPVLG